MLKTHTKQVLGLSIICLFFTHLHALEITLWPPIKCEKESRQWDISNASLYNTAFLWTKGKKIENWKYKSVDPGVFAECVEVEYETVVHIPFFFTMYTHGNEQNIKIRKKVCKSQVYETIQESVNVYNIPFLDKIDIFVAGKIFPDTTQMHADIKVDLPWYLEIVRNQIEEHITKSLQEYLSLLVQHSCGQKPQKIKLARRMIKLQTKRNYFSESTRY